MWRMSFRRRPPRSGLSAPSSPLAVTSRCTAPRPRSWKVRSTCPRFPAVWAAAWSCWDRTWPLLGSATIDARGDSGGGIVLVGGDYQGRNPDIENAQHTFVSSQSQIQADGATEGSGGKVIVWADRATQFYGSITARGGVTAVTAVLLRSPERSICVFAGP